MKMINLNQISKFTLIEKGFTNDVTIIAKSENYIQSLLNLFRKDKVKKEYFVYRWDYPRNYYPMEELDKFLEENPEYVYNPIVKRFYKKPHVVLCYSDYNYRNEIIYFNTNAEAQKYFEKIVTYTKQYEVPFIDINSEK